jgi:hypothetical protein
VGLAARGAGRSEAEAAATGDIVWVVDRPAGEDPVPKYLDGTCGSGRRTPAVNQVYFPGPKWYRWWDFGNGTMSDLGSHWNDLPFWALKLDAPKAIEAGGPPPHPEIAPASMWARYEYGPRGDLPPVTLTWHQGTAKPKIWTEKRIPQWRTACCSSAARADAAGRLLEARAAARGAVQGLPRPPKTIPTSRGHHAEWVRRARRAARPAARSATPAR